MTILTIVLSMSAVEAPRLNPVQTLKRVYVGARIVVGITGVCGFFYGLNQSAEHDNLIRNDIVIASLNNQLSIVSQRIAEDSQLLSVTRQPELQSNLSKEMALLDKDQKAIK